MRFSESLLQEIDRKGRRVAVDLEVRAAAEDGSIPFKGHAAVFNKRADIYGMWDEKVAPGAFLKTIGEADVRMLINHDPNLVLARSKSGTLRLAEDARGLLTEADLAPTSYAQDLAVTLGRGDVNQMSIGFRAIKEEWDESGKKPVRTIREAQLFDVSVVTFPAFEGTDAALRSVQFDSMLRTLGLDEMEAEKRTELLMQVTSGDVAPEFVPILRSAQERLSRLLPAGEPPPATTQPAEPAQSHSGDLDLYQRRLRLLGQRYRLPA